MSFERTKRTGQTRYDCWRQRGQTLANVFKPIPYILATRVPQLMMDDDYHNEFGGSALPGSMVRTLPIVVETPAGDAVTRMLSLAQKPGCWDTSR